jgi:hypothetical protein
VRGWKDMPTGSCKDYKEMTLTTRTRHTTYEIKRYRIINININDYSKPCTPMQITHTHTLSLYTLRKKLVLTNSPGAPFHALSPLSCT